MSNHSKKIPLMEMFGPTIQGEGAVIGQQTYFMRFGLCDYKCTMCDSMHAVDPRQVNANAQWLTQEEILDAFTQKYVQGSAKCVTLSGGNPCIHDLSVLVGALKRLGFKVVVETQGTFTPGWLSQCDVITVSPKGPGMGEHTLFHQLDKFMTYIMSANPTTVNMKIVVFDQRDLEFAKMIYERYGHQDIPFYLSLGNPYPPESPSAQELLDESVFDAVPFDTKLLNRLITNYKTLWEDIQKDDILSKMRFLPQWHVFVWGNEKGK